MGGLVLCFTMLVWCAAMEVGISWSPVDFSSTSVFKITQVKGGLCGIQNNFNRANTLLNCGANQECLNVPNGFKKCFEIVPPGGFCNNEFDKCEESGKCIPKDGNNVCVVHAHIGDKCDNVGFICVDGVICVGKEGQKKCKPPRQEHERCNQDPYWVCDKGLECVGKGNPKVHKWICKKPCDNGKVCAHGLKCVGPKGVKICKKPRQEGERCNQDPYWVCDKGLECIGHGHTAVCKKE